MLSAKLATNRALLWDIFCTVIDNYGDVGVCWRLAVNLAQRGQRVRLWLDDASALQWIAPAGHAGVTVHPWRRPLQAADLPHETADVLVEAFGCTLCNTVQTHWNMQQQSGKAGLWLNLEYLSAEEFVERNHLLPSPVLHGEAAGCSKWFFYPGFTVNTGGLLREPDLLQRQQQFEREQWLVQHGADSLCFTYSLFCYEPPALAQWLGQLQLANYTPASTARAGKSAGTQILATTGRAWQALQTAAQSAWGANTRPHCKLHALPWLTQLDFDHLLWASDCNFVRGEDSLVRALWAGKPLVWHIYPQHDNAHHAKLDAFLDWLDAPPNMRLFHHVWNGISTAALPQPCWVQWQECITHAKTRLLQQNDLVSQLLAFAAKHLPDAHLPLPQSTSAASGAL